VAVPILVEARLWVVLAAGSASMLPAGTEERLTRFGELVAAAIADAESRGALRASRARIVASADEARRRLARDVHDGAQQRQVHTVIALKQAQAALHDTDNRAAGLIEESLRQAQAATAALRELAHGIMPAALHRGGLRAGVDSLREHVSLPVQAQVLAERLPEPVEITAYFVAAEALTNVVKHAGATLARVHAFIAEGRLEVVVSDDGHGGADPAGGTGLIGLTDRVAAAGGTLSLSSPPGAGTTLSVALPIDQPTGPNGPDPAAVRPGRS
jgi:signal transduction histidine kinase